MADTDPATPGAVAERYLHAVAQQDWEVVSSCLAQNVARHGPFGDDFFGLPDYLSFLRRTMPTLPGYQLDIDRISEVGTTVAIVELRETITFDLLRLSPMSVLSSTSTQLACSRHSPSTSDSHHATDRFSPDERTYRGDTMTAYVIYQGEVHNAERYEEYKMLAAPSIIAAGGTYLARGGETTPLEGTLPATRTVLLAFPTAHAAVEWYEGEAYAAARKVREGSATATMYVVEGYEPPL